MSTTDPVPATSSTKIPINRVVAFAGPYLAVVSGAVANWLVVHIHLFGAFHIGVKTVAGAISQIAVFGITAILVYAGQHKWLTGWQKYEGMILPAFNQIMSDQAKKPPVPTVAATTIETPAPPVAQATPVKPPPPSSTRRRS